MREAAPNESVVEERGTHRLVRIAKAEAPLLGHVTSALHFGRKRAPEMYALHAPAIREVETMARIERATLHHVLGRLCQIELRSRNPVVGVYVSDSLARLLTGAGSKPALERGADVLAFGAHVGWAGPLSRVAPVRTPR